MNKKERALLDSLKSEINNAKKIRKEIEVKKKKEEDEESLGK